MVDNATIFYRIEKEKEKRKRKKERKESEKSWDKTRKVRDGAGA